MGLHCRLVEQFTFVLRNGACISHAQDPERLNESQTLAIMIYSHFVLVVMRIVAFALSGNISDSLLNRVQSILFSADTIVALAVYFVPKLTATEETVVRHGFSATIKCDAALLSMLVILVQTRD